MSRKIVPFEQEAKRNLTVFSIGAALNDTGEEMYAPYLSYYASTILGVTPEQYGIIEGVTEAFNRLLRGITGLLSDKWGRKPPIVLGYILIAVSRLGLGLVRGWLGFIPMRGLRQIGRALRDPAREASITESVPPHQRGKAFGLLNAVDTFGAVLGPIIGLFILYSATTGFFYINITDSSKTVFPQHVYIWLFMWASVPTLISAWVILTLLKETVQKETLSDKDKSKNNGIISKVAAGVKEIKSNLKNYFIDKKLRDVTISHMVLAISAVPMQMILFYAYSIGATPFEGAILFVVYSILHFTSSYPSGMLVDKIGRFRSQLLANALCIITLVSLAFIKTPLLIIIPIALYGVFDSLWLTSRRSIIADLAPVTARASTLGTFSMMYGLTSLLSPILVGFFWYRISPAFAFLVMGAIGVVATLILLRMNRK
jgi:MFS family permease